MIDTVTNLLFRCSHRRLTRPVTPVSKAGVPRGDTYVVCLDCGKQFAYDVREMRIGKAIARPEGVLPPNARKGASKLKYTLWAVPVGMILGAFIQSNRKKAVPQPAAKESSPAASEAPTDKSPLGKR